ncbi:MAG: hypothetical protein Greene041619_1166 [Candidatus Peregrinibacteria bacterium Greene0416_19]|nr:MAG: hypothetical protein Greene041619_1166 [Candidatus Peregrinibacteria bacterium Greene0416_19]
MGNIIGFSAVACVVLVLLVLMIRAYAPRRSCPWWHTLETSLQASFAKEVIDSRIILKSPACYVVVYTKC